MKGKKTTPTQKGDGGENWWTTKKGEQLNQKHRPRAKEIRSQYPQHGCRKQVGGRGIAQKGKG